MFKQIILLILISLTASQINAEPIKQVPVYGFAGVSCNEFTSGTKLFRYTAFTWTMGFLNGFNVYLVKVTNRRLRLSEFSEKYFSEKMDSFCNIKGNENKIIYAGISDIIENYPYVD